MHAQGEIMKANLIGSGTIARRWFCSCVAAVLGKGKKEQRTGAGMRGGKSSLTPFHDARNDKSASEGCIIAPRRCREAIPVGETVEVVR